MKVRCISNHTTTLPEAYREFGYQAQKSLPLTIGKEYIVYAIAFRKGQVWYFIENDDVDALGYPSREPAVLFEIIDGSLPSCWHFVLTPDHRDHLALLSFPEWTSDRYFYDRLTDGNPADVEIYTHRRLAIKAEYSYPQNLDQ